MEWLNRRKAFSDAELTQFDFCPSAALFTQTVYIQRPESQESPTTVKKEIRSEDDYLEWLEETVPAPSQGHPGLVLAVHSRISSDDSHAPKNPRSTSLRHSRDTFRAAATRLFQHRSIAYVVCRRSTAVFTSRKVDWGTQSHGDSIVYSCRSDTESLGDEDDMTLSVTWFPKHRKSYGVLYGCSNTMLKHTKRFTDKVGDSEAALHPLLLPVIFIELERKRLFNNFDFQESEIYTRILNMERRLSVNDDAHGDNEKGGAAFASEGWDATNLWMNASSLSSGLESFRVQLGRMAEHSRWLSETCFAAKTGESEEADGNTEQRDIGTGIEGRLQEIMDECESKVRSLNTLLKGMSLATQMEWNYHSRQNARHGHLIAERAKKDSGQMTTIARLGMIFLPGTFLASVFSTTFFKWIPEDSHQMVSPYFVIYATLAIALTYLLFTKFWKWRVWNTCKRRKKRPAGTGEV